MMKRIFFTVIAVFIFLTLTMALTEARITKIEIESVASPAFGGQVFGDVGQYEKIDGKAYGEINPLHPLNAIIQDIDLAPKNTNGNVEYVATFSLAKPIDMSKANGVLRYSVVNRGLSLGGSSPGPEGHVSLISGWQGDLTNPSLQTIQVPVAKNPDGSSITGPFLVRFFDPPPDTNTMPITEFDYPIPYQPASLDTTEAILEAHTSETIDGVIGDIISIPSTDWAFADCTTVPFPGTPDPSQICLKDGFDPTLLYQLVYTVKDPLVLGIGLAAIRDIVSFFKYETLDDLGTGNPVADSINWAIGYGSSQAGNLLKTFIHLGFNEDESGRIVWDGANPNLAGRQNPINFRFAFPGGAAGLYELGSEPVLWWDNYHDMVRDREPAGMLDRCRTTNTCPKIFETFTSNEFWYLRMSPGMVGTDPKDDIPLPPNVRRYYFPGTSHGGYPIATGCVLPPNPNSISDTMRALTVAFEEWVVEGIEPPQSQYPRFLDGQLVSATKAAMEFPSIPGMSFTDNLVNPLLDYNFGDDFIHNDMGGVISNLPPEIEQVIPTLVPAVDEDGNEIGGIPSVRHQVPLGTYTGWNITESGFFKDQICGLWGGFHPFSETKDERLASGDPRLSLEERYGDHDGYVAAVRAAAEDLVSQRFLLPEDAERLIQEAEDSGVLNTGGITWEEFASWFIPAVNKIFYVLGWTNGDKTPK